MVLSAKISVLSSIVISTKSRFFGAVMGRKLFSLDLKKQRGRRFFFGKLSTGIPHKLSDDFLSVDSISTQISYNYIYFGRNSLIICNKYYNIIDYTRGDDFCFEKKKMAKVFFFGKRGREIERRYS